MANIFFLKWKQKIVKEWTNSKNQKYSENSALWVSQEMDAENIF